MRKGFVYILSNPASPGMLKVGFPSKVPTERAIELDTTGVASPFEVEYYCLVDGPAAVEAEVHSALAAYRHRPDREFFCVDVEDAISAVVAQAREAEHTWRRPPVVKQRPQFVTCSKCGARYGVAEYCHKCRTRLMW